MAREVVISVLCDACRGESGTRTEGTHTETLTIGNQTRVLDLCDPHRDKITGQIHEWLSWGTKPETAAGSPRGLRIPGGPLQCPICGRVAASKAALGKHSRKYHDLGLLELEAAEPGAGGEAPPKGDAAELPYVCELCGKPYSMAKGLGVHKRYSHNIVGASSVTRAATASRRAS